MLSVKFINFAQLLYSKNYSYTLFTTYSIYCTLYQLYTVLYSICSFWLVPSVLKLITYSWVLYQSRAHIFSLYTTNCTLQYITVHIMLLKRPIALRTICTLYNVQYSAIFGPYILALAHFALFLILPAWLSSPFMKFDMEGGRLIFFPLFPSTPPPFKPGQAMFGRFILFSVPHLTLTSDNLNLFVIFLLRCPSFHKFLEILLLELSSFHFFTLS